MKKVYSTLLVAALAISAFAQRTDVSPRQVVTPGSTLHRGTTTLRGENSSTRANSYWLNYALQLDDPLGYTPGTAAGDFLLLFPDSQIIVGQYTTGETAYPQFHKAGVILDPKNMPVQSINSSNMYSLDSLAIAYAYLRALSPNVVDTLVIQVIKHDASLEFDLTAETYQDITYDYTTNKITQSQVLGTYTYLLQESDSTSSVGEILIATPGIANQAGTNRIGVVISYKPGYSYSITDSVFDKNAFFLFTFEQNGVNTDPTFYGTLGQGTSDLNCSYSLPTDVRYNINGNGWNGYFIPTWAWTTPYAYEHHIVSFHLNEVVGVQENEMVSLSESYPNPCDASGNVKYTLKSEANVTIELTDLTGKTVLVQNEGSQAAGEYNTALNTSELASGVYMLTLRAGEGSVVTKLVVQH